MAWFSRDKKASPTDLQAAAAVTAPPVPASAAEAPAGALGGAGASPGPAEADAAQPDSEGSVPETGKYGPKVSITSFDSAPAELGWQLPLNGELFAVLPGPDRPDYSVLVLERPLHFYPGAAFDLTRLDDDQRTEDRRGRPMASVHALLVCARFVGQQLHPGMSDLAVNVAYVIDNSLARDEVVDFTKIEFAAVGQISEGHRSTSKPASDEQPATAQPTQIAHPEAQEEPHTEPQDEAPAEPQAEPHTEPQAEPEASVAPDAEPLEPGEVGDQRPPPMIIMSEVLAEAVAALRAGIAAQRAAEVENLTVTLALDAANRVTGLSGNADGQPPVPTPETFERLNEVLARLNELPPDHAVEQLTLTLEGDAFTSDVQYRT